MSRTIRITLPEEVTSELDLLTQQEGCSRSEVLREALRDYLFVRRFRALRTRMMAQAQARGVFTDEDVFERVS